MGKHSDEQCQAMAEQIDKALQPMADDASLLVKGLAVWLGQQCANQDMPMAARRVFIGLFWKEVEQLIDKSRFSETQKLGALRKDVADFLSDMTENDPVMIQVNIMVAWLLRMASIQDDPVAALQQVIETLQGAIEDDLFARAKEEETAH